MLLPGWWSIQKKIATWWIFQQPTRQLVEHQSHQSIVRGWIRHAIVIGIYWKPLVAHDSNISFFVVGGHSLSIGPRFLRKGLQIIATTIDYGVLPTTGEPSSIRPWPQDACGRARTIGLSCVEYLLQRTWGWRCSGLVSIEGNTLKAAINYGGQQIVADSWRMLQEYLKISNIGSLAN